MTGFARADGAHENRRWVWEVKSVNGRGLEMRFRLPAGFDSLEQNLRGRISKSLKRGSVFANLQMTTAAGETRMRINEPALADALEAVDKVRLHLECAPPQAEAILGLRGVMEAADDTLDDEAREALNKALSDSFAGALAALKSARDSEGAAMASVVAEHVDDIEKLTAKADADPSTSLEAIRARISAQLAELTADSGLTEERLAQEAALMAVKADIREELNRLKAHVEAARALLSRGGAIGRELDFLTQEFNRETNTLCSKAQNMELKQIGLEMKKVIDQLREQVQNIE